MWLQAPDWCNAKRGQIYCTRLIILPSPTILSDLAGPLSSQVLTFFLPIFSGLCTTRRPRVSAPQQWADSITVYSAANQQLAT